MKKLGVLVAVMFVVSAFAIPTLAAPVDSKAFTAAAQVNPKITLTLSSNTIDWGAMDPGTSSAVQAANITIDSNKAFKLEQVAPTNWTRLDAGTYQPPISTLQYNFNGAGMQAMPGGTTGLVPNRAKGQNINYTNSLQAVWTWDSEPGSYEAQITYTATQL